MSDDESLSAARRWLRYAREDLVAAELAVTSSAMAPRHACWLAQQSAEKALKTVLVFLQIEFPYRHDLDALRNLVPPGWVLKRDHPDLAELTEWAVEARYPGDAPDANETDAARAADQARALLGSVVHDLREHGFVFEPGDQ